MERLYRSRREKMLGGVCGGLAEYFNADVLLVRLLALVALFAGIGVLAYLVAWILIPLNPLQDSGSGYEADSRPVYVDQVRNRERKTIAGVILVVLGLLFFMDSWFPHWLSFGRMWPLLLILIGAAILVRRERQ